MTSFYRHKPLEGHLSPGMATGGAGGAGRDLWGSGKDHSPTWASKDLKDQAGGGGGGGGDRGGGGSGGGSSGGGGGGAARTSPGGGGCGEGVGSSRNNPPDPHTQRVVLEELLERRLAQGDFWYVVVAEWLEHLKKYLGIASSRKYYQKRVSAPPGAVVTRRDYAHTVDVVHEDAWRMLVLWYGLAEGHKPIKLVVYTYTRGPEIEHNINAFKVTLTHAPPEDFHNVRFSKMEKSGYVEWKARELYRVPKSQKSRMWAKADADSPWQAVLARDKPIGKALEMDSDFTRPIIALEVCGRDGVWGGVPEGVEPAEDTPTGPLYEHSIFEDVTTPWEVDIHDQIDHIGKALTEKLHHSFSAFVARAKDYVEDRDNHVRERERDLCEREGIVDRLSARLESKEARLDAELRACEVRMADYEGRRAQLEAEHAERTAANERALAQRLAEVQEEKEALERDRLHFDRELKKMSELYKVQDSRIKLDIGGVHYTTSVMTLSRDPNSMLAAMFSGRHELKREGDGSYFIDRDGTHFRYILNFLRDGEVKDGTLPSNPSLWRELLTEAEFYQLSDLVHYLESLLYGKQGAGEGEEEEAEKTSTGDTFV